jgi:serine/threonine-protein kinase
VPFIAMELLRGEDLSMLLRRQERLGPGQLVPIVNGIAAALEAAHAVGIVHRDLKPQNVFLPSSGGVRLLDFGVARFEATPDGDAATRLTMGLLGSPGYLAPEQIRDHAAVGPRTDVFGLGAIVYRALTGIGAFPSRSAAEAIYEALHSQPRVPSALEPGLHPDVDSVIALALAKALADRYASAGELAADLARAFEGALAPETRTRAAPLLSQHEDTLAPGGTITALG